MLGDGFREWRFAVKTKGALIWEFNQPWSIEEIEIGDPQKGEVKVQMEASGMCHSDHHLVTGGIPMFGFPVLGGHEGAGIVTEVGEGVEDVKPGDHVVLSFIPSCGKCPSCQAGLRNLCDLGAGLLAGTAISDGTHRIHAKGQPVFPMTLLGTFSPYMVVHESSVVKIDPSIPFEVACLVGCARERARRFTVLLWLRCGFVADSRVFEPRRRLPCGCHWLVPRGHTPPRRASRTTPGLRDKDVPGKGRERL